MFLLRPPSSAYDDEAIDMASGSIAHGAICAQLSYLLVGALRGKPCRAYSSNTRTKLSEKRDRGAKFNTYKGLPTVQEYMLVGSEYRSIEVHRREGTFWRMYHYRTGDQVELTSIGVRFPFDEVYEGIEL